MRIRAVVFDFDGTLTKPALNFAALREALGCPPGRPVLEFIRALPDSASQERANSILEQFEWEAARQATPNPGSEQLVRYLLNRGVKVAILSRNTRRSIERSLGNFELLKASDFSVILSRETTLQPKPDPEGIHEAARLMRVPVEEVLVVGDFLFDIEAGRRAGSPTVLLTNGADQPSFACDPTWTVRELSEIRALVERHAPLACGKLPNSLLQSFLRGLPEPDPTLLIGPAVGEDVAAVSLAGEEVLVLKTDPVTLASDSAAHYTVVVNANDLATCGAVPRWFLASLLFPPGTTASEVEQVIQELARTAECCGMTLCGGHTEITDAVARPVLVGQAVGTIVRSRLIRKSGMRQGDRIILTKRLAVEGSSIIARDLPAKLRRQGMPDGEIEAARRFLETPGISVLVEARVAAGFTGVSAMHDVTEGGLAVAVEELSTAGRHRLRIETDRIPVYPETTRICSMLGLNPLGLIGSGSLLICCRPHCAAELSAAVRAAGVEATEIGEVLETGAGVAAYREGQPTEWPRFEVDEIARLFSSSSGARD